MSEQVEYRGFVKHGWNMWRAGALFGFFVAVIVDALGLFDALIAALMRYAGS